MQTLLKPDRLNGTDILRPVTEGADGVNHVNKEVIFLPSIKISLPQPKPIEELIETALNALVTVSDQHGDPLVRQQALMFKGRLQKHQGHWMTVAALNERATIVAYLNKRGFKEAAESLAL